VVVYEWRRESGEWGIGNRKWGIGNRRKKKKFILQFKYN